MLPTEELIDLWARADFMLKAAKALESHLRDNLSAALLADNKKDAIGTFNFFVADREVQVTVTESLTLEEAEYDIHKATLNDAEKEAIEFKPSIIKKKYKALPKDSILKQECVVKKTGKPAVKIIS